MSGIDALQALLIKAQISTNPERVGAKSTPLRTEGLLRDLVNLEAVCERLPEDADLSPPSRAVKLQRPCCRRVRPCITYTMDTSLNQKAKVEGLKETRNKVKDTRPEDFFVRMSDLIFTNLTVSVKPLGAVTAWRCQRIFARR